MTVYGKIENGVFTPAPYGDVDYLISQGYSAFADDLVSKYFAGQVEVQNGTLVDITGTDEYKAKALSEQNAFKKANLQSQIDDLDKKRVRAGFEPSVKDSATSQTWLEYYTSQIQDLRTQIAALN